MSNSHFVPKTILGTISFVFLAAQVAFASPIVIPGIAAGGHYRVAFVTAGTRDATSTSLADYNAFVTAQANASPELAALNTTWRVIGTVGNISAPTNMGGPIDSPIYNLGGQLIADSLGDMFDGQLMNPVRYDQYGNDMGVTNVFTGTNSTGTGNVGVHLGNNFLVYVGQADQTGPEWLLANVNFWTDSRAFYAISGDLVVPPIATPEPSTVLSMAIGIVLLSIGRRRLAGDRLS